MRAYKFVCACYFSVCECVGVMVLMGLSVTATWSNEEKSGFCYVRKHISVKNGENPYVLTHLIKDFFRRSLEVLLK